MDTKQEPHARFSWYALVGSLLIGLALVGGLTWVAAPATPVAYAAGDTWFVSPTGDDSNDCSDDTTNACLSIQRAIEQATDGDIISIASGVYTGTTIGKNLTLVGADPSNTIVDGFLTSRVLTITGDVTLSGLTIQRGVADNGGGIHSTGALTITGSTVITGNAATTGDGGGIYSTGAVTITSGTVISNAATTGDGGGIYVGTTESSLFLGSGATVQHNAAAASGGGISVQGEATLSGTTIYSNTAVENGGGIAVNGGTLVMGNNTTLSENAVLGASPNDVNGGGLYANGSDVTISNSTIEGNYALMLGSDAARGGGLYLDGGDVTLSEVVVRSNVVTNTNGPSYGGGIYVSGPGIITGTIVDANTAFSDGGDSYGGGLYINVDMTIENSTISNNRAVDPGGSVGGGLVLGGTGTTTVRNTTISGNTADTDGGGVYTDGSNNATLTNTTISGNTADTNGGGIYHDSSGTTTLNSTTVTDNDAGNEGGGVVQNSGTLNATSTIIGGNTATSNPDCSGTISSGDYNLVEDTTGCSLSGSNNITDVDPNLGTLANNGGATFTHLPNTGSPALDAGTCQSGAITSDQRGEPRPMFAGVGFADDACDIGSVEVEATLQANNDSVFLFPSLPDLDITVLANDTGPIDWATVEVVYTDETDLGGTLSVDSEGIVTYTPPADLIDFTDTFTYTVKDTSGTLSDEATVEVYVSNTIPCSADRTDLLIAAIESANSNLDHNTIYLTTDCDYVLTEAYSGGDNGLPAVTEDLTIRGRGATIRRDEAATDEFRIIEADGGTGTLLELQNVTLAGGYLTGSKNGGALYAHGTHDLRLGNTSIVSSTAQNGGGIYIDGSGSTTTITRTAIVSSTATGDGGGLSISNGNVTMINTTVSGNTAETGSGGGIDVAGGTLEATHITVAYNEAGTGGGINQSSGTATIRSTIVAHNTAGTNNNCAGTVSDDGYSVSNDTTCGTDKDSATVPLEPLALNGGTTLNHKLGAAPNTAVDAVDDGSCTTIGGATVLLTDQRGSLRPIDQTAHTGERRCDAGAFELELPVGGTDDAATTQGVDIVIDVLENDFHPYDPEVTIDPSTVEIESGEGPYHGTITNIDGTTGEITYSPDASFVGGDMFRYLVTDTEGWQSDAITVTIGVQIPCETPKLIEALNTANSDPDHTTIHLSASCVYTLTNEYTGPEPAFGNTGLPDIYTPMTIRGNGATIERLDTANDEFRIFYVDTTGQLELNDLTLTGGDPGTGNHGGAIYNTYALTLTNSTIENNTAANGGGVYNDAGTDFRMDDSTIQDNHATNGGGVYNGSGASMVMDDSTIRDNWATTNGGGLYSNEADLTLRWSSVRNNGYDPDGTTQTDNGGGIYHTGDNVLDFHGLYLTGNRATTDGGGLYNDGGQVDDLTFARINDNEAGGNGGAVYMTGSSSTFGLERGRIYGNQADNGGAFSIVNGGTATFTHMSVYENTADADGAGFYVGSSGTLTITTSTLSGNASGDQGGAVYNAGTATTQINNSTVYANTASTNGGGIFNSGGTVELYSTIVAGPTSGNPSDCAGTGGVGLRTGETNGFNLAIIGRGCTPGGSEDQSVSSGQILLGDLQDHGDDWWAGPTHTPLEGSAAVDMGDCTVTGEETDQHDGERPVEYASASSPGDGCEVGSVEGIQFIVNSASPLPDNYPYDRDCEAGGNDGAGDPYCTLQSAIHEANLYPGRDIITFDIVGTEQADSSSTNNDYYKEYYFDRAFILMPQQPLPPITSSLVIDAETQDGTQCRWDNRTLKVVLDGSSITAQGTDGLHVQAGDTTILGLGIQNFTGDGVEIENADNVRLFCDNISNNGTDPIETYGGHGVNISEGASNNRIGETWWSGNANVISHNGGSGVYISSPASHRNRILANSIFQNDWLGIDLADTTNEDSYRVNPNDPGDYDDGPNALQNYPTIETATIEGGQIVLSGQLNSNTGRRYRLQFFANSDDSCDPTHGEGEIFVGESHVITNTQFNNTFTYAFDIPQGAETYRSVSATATDSDGNTSEFSICAAMNSSIGNRVWVDTNADGIQDEGEPGLAGVTVQLYKRPTSGSDILVDTRTTDADGLYGFGNLLVGNYYVVVEQPDSYVFTAQDQGSDDELDSDIDPATGQSALFLLPSKTIDESRDAGLMKIGVTITESDDSTDVTEGGADDDYTIVLDSKPSADVTIQITSGGNQVQAIPETIVFTPDTWNVPRTVRVEANDDAAVEGNHTGTLRHTLTSDDPAYNGELDPMTVNIVDNDTAGVEIDPVGVDVSEDGDTATYDVRLTYEPTATVRIAFETDTEIDAIETLEFDPDTWDVSQRVTVRAVDDTHIEGTPHESIILHEVLSSDPRYDGLSVTDVTVSITDNDGPGVKIDLPDDFQVSEEGETSVDYYISLTSKPQVGSSVTISIAGTIGQATVTPQELTFDSTNWDTPKAVQVQAVDDDLIEGPHIGIISHGVSSTTDPDYENVDIPNVEVAIVDNDMAAVLLSPTSVSVNEQGETTDVYAISLAKQPTDKVTIKVTSRFSQVTVTPSEFTFTTANWNTPREITVKAADDLLVEGPHSDRLDHTATSNDPDYDGLEIDDVYVGITDNDKPGVEVVPTLLNVAEEDETTDTYIVRLTSAPTNTVTIRMTADTSQVTVVPDEITFDTDNWDTEHIVTVRAVDDTDEEGTPHRTTIRHEATTDDNTGGYHQIAVEQVDVSIADNDTPGVNIVPVELDVVEGGATADYEIVLTKQPADTVTVNITTTNKQVKIVGSTAITFSATTWKTPKVITVRAIDDAVAEGVHVDTLKHTTSSDDPDYDTGAVIIQNVKVNIGDNDSPGVNVSPTSIEVSENGTTASYDVVLASEPEAEVTVTLVANGAQLDVRPPTLTFDADNWNTPQVVDVRAVDDLYAEGAHNSTISHEMASSDPSYNDDDAPFLVDDVAVTIRDNDSAGVEITPLTVETSEDGDIATYEVQLGSRPREDVTIVMDFDNAQLRVVPPTVTFEAATWTTSTVRIIYVYAEDDDVGEGPHSATISHDSQSSDPLYDSGAVIIPNVKVNIDDNETAGVNISKTELNISEDVDSREDTYNITLNYPPTSNVTVTITTLQGDQVTVIPPYLVFTPENWNTPKTVTVRSLEDDITEGTHTERIIHSTDSADPAYKPDMFAIDDVVITLEDNDSPGVGVAPTTLRVSEDGTKAYYDVKLNSAPTQEVIIQVNAGSQLAAVPIDMTFDETNWDTPQRVTVKAIDDDVAEGLHSGRITHNIDSLDPNYDGSLFFVEDVNVTIDDNDSPGVTISPQSVRVSEDGTTATYDVWLNSEPTAKVRVSMETGTQTTVKPPYLEFDAANWDSRRTITVYAVDDFIDEGLHSGRIRHTVESTDPMYAPDMFAIADVDVTIDDNDTAGVSIEPTQVEVSEDGDTDTYEVQLTSQPLAPVTVVISNTKGQVRAAPTTLLFDETNWDTARTVTVAAVDDDLVEGMHTGLIIHTVESEAAAYQPDMFAIADVEAVISDNDSADVFVSPATVEVAEGGQTATYSVTLSYPPTADVVLSLMPDEQLTTEPMTLTIPSSEWDTGHLITVEAVDDALIEGLHTGIIAHSTTSDDPLYISAQRFDIDDVTAKITDNDAAGILISPTTVEVEEGGATATYSVSLTTIPTSPVQLQLTIDSQIVVTPTQITLTDTSPHTVTVQAVDDTLIEGAHSTSIRHDITSDDPDYDGSMFAIPDVKVNIADNDGAGLVQISPVALTVEEEGETTDTYSVVLTEEPVGTVEVYLLGNTGQITISAERLVFTTDNWTTPQTVTVQAVDDAIYEGDHTVTIEHQVFSSDPLYNFSDAADVVVTIKDNEEPPPVVYGIYFPIILSSTKADLAAQIILEPAAPYVEGQPVEVTIVISNTGATVINPFWVDFYVNPTQAPDANTTWQDVSEYGITWYVTDKIEPGETIILKSTPEDYLISNTNWDGSFREGAQYLYVYVDVWKRPDQPTATGGSVPETDETNNLTILEIPPVTKSGTAVSGR